MEIKPTAILTADIHIREDAPLCRTDDFWETQIRKILFLKQQQEKYKCPVFIAGDIFDHWKPSPFLLGWVLENLPDSIIAIPGQHDLPQHSIDMINKSGIFVLAAAGKIQVLLEGQSIIINSDTEIYGFPFGSKLDIAEDKRAKHKTHRVAMCHELTWKDKMPYPGCTNRNASSFLRKMSGFSLVLVGDNHQTFTHEENNRILVSPGSFMRTTAAQIEHRPCIYLWFAKDNKIEPLYLPIEEGVVTREHIEHSEERDRRVDAFLTRLKDDIELKLSFRANLESYMKLNDVRGAVQAIVWRALDGDNEQRAG